MRGMSPRQAKQIYIVLILALALSACSTSVEDSPTPPPLPTSTLPLTPLPIPTLPSATPTPLTCLSQPGQVTTGSVPTPGTPTNFIIYLPPCYDYFTDQRYPVLYLLNGLPLVNDPASAGTQWVRMGAPDVADEMNRSRQFPPFIIVFPEDRYWNVLQGTYFGQFMIYNIVPYIDTNFRTIADRPHRAVGGLSRGGGWAWQFALRNPDVFGVIGLHSPAIFPDDRAEMEYYLNNRDPASWPLIYIDSGRDDHELGYNTILEGLLTSFNIPHEWHLNIGQHNENYWSSHMVEYLIWYAQAFSNAGPPLPTLTPTPTLVPSSTPPLTFTPTPSPLAAYAYTGTAAAAEASPTESTPGP